MTKLTHSTAETAELLKRMVELPWPTNEQDRLSYFNELGLQDTDESGKGTLSARLPEMVDHSFTVPSLSRVDGSCSVFRGEVLGLTLFCYNRPVDNDLQARKAYALLHGRLTATLGAPAEEWGTSGAPACLWRAGPLHLDMYCFQRGSSGVMVGPATRNDRLRATPLPRR